MKTKLRSLVVCSIAATLFISGCAHTPQQIEAEKTAFFSQARYGSIESVVPAQAPAGKSGDYVAVTAKLDMTAESVTVIQPAAMSNHMPPGERVSVGIADGFGMAVSLINNPDEIAK